MVEKFNTKKYINYPQKLPPQFPYTPVIHIYTAESANKVCNIIQKSIEYLKENMEKNRGNNIDNYL